MLACLLAVLLLGSKQHDESRQLRTVVPTRRAPIIVDHEEPELVIATNAARLAFDPVLQTALFSPAPQPLLSFEGAGEGIRSITASATPPDANAAVGPAHVVEVVNFSFTVFDKKGKVLFGPASPSSFWSGFAGPCQGQYNGDPVVLYDRLSDRWVMTQQAWDDAAGAHQQCFAVSTTPDPLGSWYRYQYDFPGHNDYGKIGLWTDAYLFSTAVDGPSWVCALERARMLAGLDAPLHCFPAPQNEPQPFPVDVDGTTAPPAGEAPYFISSPPLGTLGVFRLKINWVDPSKSSLSARSAVPVAPWNPASDALAVTQPGTAQRLAASTGILRHRLAYRNFGDHESVVVTHTVDAGGGTIGVRWYELRADGVGDLAVFQQGTFAPDSNHRFMSSAAMDRNGNIAVGYTVSSSSVYPSIRYAARLAGDPPGLLTLGETSLNEGVHAQEGVYRWGDYTSLQVDPVDDCTFWFTGEYAGSFSPRTRLSAFRLPGCANDFALTVSTASREVLAGGSVKIAVKTATVSGSPETIQLTATGMPAGTSAAFVPAAIAAGGTSELTISATADAKTPAQSTMTISGSSPSASHHATVQIAVVAPAPDAGGDDAGAPDASVPDAGSDDAGLTDASSPDGGATGPRPPSLHPPASGGCSSAPVPFAISAFALVCLRSGAIRRRVRVAWRDDVDDFAQVTRPPKRTAFR